MNLPTNLPTDNIYKFFAISGLIIILFTLIFPESKEGEIRTQDSAIRLDSAKAEAKKRNMEFQREKIKSKITDFEKICNCKIFLGQNDSMLYYKRILRGNPEEVKISSQIDDLSAEYRLVEEEYLESMAILIEKKEQIINKYKELIFYQKLTEGLYSFGIILTVIGFSFWYFKTQVLQDKILKKQYEAYVKVFECQSCGVNFMRDPKYLSKKEEFEHNKYCTYCYNYETKEFNEPNLNIKQLRKRIKKKLLKEGHNRIAVWIFINFSNNLRSLDRWSPKFTWWTKS